MDFVSTTVHSRLVVSRQRSLVDVMDQIECSWWKCFRVALDGSNSASKEQNEGMNHHNFGHHTHGNEIHLSRHFKSRFLQNYLQGLLVITNTPFPSPQTTTQKKISAATN